LNSNALLAPNKSPKYANLKERSPYYSPLNCCPCSRSKLPPQLGLWNAKTAVESFEVRFGKDASRRLRSDLSEKLVGRLESERTISGRVN